MNIKLGNFVVDKTTGLEGYAVSFLTHLSGSTQVTIQPNNKTVEMADAYHVDWHMVEVISDGLAEAASKLTAAVSPIKLGEEVTDILSGFKGMVVGTIQYMNGCVSHNVQAKGEKSDVLSDSVFFDWKRLKVIGPGVSVVVEPEIKKPITARTGGPSIRASSMRHG